MRAILLSTQCIFKVCQRFPNELYRELFAAPGFMPGTHIAFGGHVSQSPSVGNISPAFVCVDLFTFEDYRPVIL